MIGIPSLLYFNVDLWFHILSNIPWPWLHLFSFKFIAMKKFILGIALVAVCGNLFSQDKRICILGSSTSYGYGVLPSESYAGKVKQYYKDLNLLDTLYNFGTSGTDCYMAMPSSYVPPPGRNAPNPAMNITRAVNLVPKPDVIIVNFPSNNYQWLPYNDVIFCLQTIKDSANAAGIACYITTTQPRDDFSTLGSPVSERQRLKDLKALIIQTFGTYSIDFWTDIVQDPPIIIRSEYALGDNVHLNPAGHTVLAQKVIEKNFFFTTVACRFGKLDAAYRQNKVYLQWNAWCSNENFEIQKSSNGINFSGLFSETDDLPYYHLKNQTTVDDRPLAGKNFYRIAAKTSSGNITYSPIVMVDTKADGFETKVFPSVFSNGITISLNLPSKQDAEILVTDSRGAVVLKRNELQVQQRSFYLDMSRYVNQTYFIKIKTAAGSQLHTVVKQ